MSVIVRVPTPLRKITNGQGEIQATAKNISELIENLEKNFPGMKGRLCDETGNVRKFINIFINEEDIRFKENLKTALKDGDDISIVPAIAGGKLSRENYR
ncbi:MAG: MoaD/ThiS family protein [Chlamydiae bacterium]|nr:MoaD/ThiS family protein [Chlamydiota bacterium]MBI3278076.1 MoaD/ThiS family protein [Chlamydiota bacterium]